MSVTPCIPDRLPLDGLDWKRLAANSSKAMLAMARYDGTLDGMVNAAVLLSPITSQEAVLSSRIEGTQASLVELLRHEAGEIYSDEKQQDIREIINYRRALLMAEDALKERPITVQMVRELHALLTQGVRGSDRTPGALRTTQNWIGSKGTPIEQARFVPPSPLILRDALENWEAYVASDDTDPLVQLAVVHAQFEIIHPFNDGNGRLGRMLVPLFLFQKGVLRRPMFYLSEHLEERDEEYRDRLLAVTKAGDWQEWIEFFLQALHAQAVRNTDKAKRIHALYEEMKPRFVEITHSQFAIAALDAFFTKPIMTSGDFLNLTHIANRGTANALLRGLVSGGMIQILAEASGRRPAIYALASLINITEGRTVLG